MGKKKTIGFFLFLLVTTSILIFSTKIEKTVQVESVSSKQSNLLFKIEEIEELQIKPSYDGLYSYIGMDQDQLIAKLGQPLRIDPSAYDYDWWIYKQNSENYIQVGIENEKVVTAFGIGSQIQANPFYIGQPIDEIISQNLLKPTVQVTNDTRFELTEDEMISQPLIVIGDVFIQLYFDTFTKKISSIRFMDENTLLKQRPYELIYRGELLSAKTLSAQEWKDVEKGMTTQIYDITNVIRELYGVTPLKWDEKTASVAYNHSKDMKVNSYFSHTSPTNEGLAERLAKGEVIYKLAGENIAAKYVDSIAVVEGWLNSKGHRETLLNKEYTYIGVGVFEKYYTQNFIQKWE